jgi:S-DNA-T family DNA segregation ATPase FtsK/SpoIIIE
MATVIRKKHDSEIKTRWRAAALYGFGTLALILALGSHDPQDPSLNTFNSTWGDPKNVLGYLGSWTSDFFYQLFGYAAWCWPLLWGSTLIRWLTQDHKEEPVFKQRDWGSLAIAVCALSLFIHLVTTPDSSSAFPPQGLLGIAISGASLPLLGRIGSYFLVAVSAWLFCMLWWEELPFHMLRGLRRLARGLHAIVMKAAPTAAESASNPNLKRPSRFNSYIARSAEALTKSIAAFIALFTDMKESMNRRSEQKAAPAVKPQAMVASEAEEQDEEEESEEEEDEESLEASAEDEEESEEDEEGEEEATASSRPTIRMGGSEKAKPQKDKVRPKAGRTADEVTDWQLPPMSLLQSAKLKIKPPTQEQLFATAERITNALKSFDIEGEVVEVSPGPIITMYEFQPAPGVRVSKLVSAQTDLAMTLGVPSVRVVAPIPGKCVAGIEVPNTQKQEIVLKDVFENTRDRASSMKLPLVFGVDTEGNPVAEDLARMPHLLVGGATNMGKSVLVNSMLTGLLCRFTPEQLKLIVVDPKLVEFKVFEDIPHLLLPVVNDPSDASQALKWAVGETKRRYLEMQKVSAKNLEAYNKKISEGKVENAEHFPYILIIIDELAELMLTAKKDVEQSIVRLSQLARAAGIHLIMATQRPSADVVTGLIKSNCPSRAALRVASASDSRIVLDCSGAEQLLGRGDMFFTNAGPMGLKRMQGSYVSDEEIERVCDFWREQGEPAYREEILAPENDDAQMDLEADGDVDALYGDVLDFAKEKGKVSTSLIQRRFQIGYTRAARIMDQLEQRGVVGESGAAGKPRDVII